MVTWDTAGGILVSLLQLASDGILKDIQYKRRDPSNHFVSQSMENTTLTRMREADLRHFIATEKRNSEYLVIILKPKSLLMFVVQVLKKTQLLNDALKKYRE